MSVRPSCVDRGVFDCLVTDTDQVEKLREWFGTPVAAGKTLVWLCWVSLLGSVLLGLLYVLALGLETVI